MKNSKQPRTALTGSSAAIICMLPIAALFATASGPFFFRPFCFVFFFPSPFSPLPDHSTEAHLRQRIDDLQWQLSKSKHNMKKASKKKSKKKLARRKGFDTRKTKGPRTRPTKTASRKPGGKKKKKEWKPPSIFAVADTDSFAFQQSEAQALKKKIYAQLRGAQVAISQTATATTVEQAIEAELKRSENVSSIFLVNVGWVVDKFLQWKYLMPRVEPFYAVKSNPDPVILRTLKMMGSGFDCASEAELAAVKTMGQASNNIIFANPCSKTLVFYSEILIFIFAFSPCISVLLSSFHYRGQVAHSLCQAAAGAHDDF